MTPEKNERRTKRDEAAEAQISLLADNARWTREDVVSCAQRQHGVDTTRHHLKEFQREVGVLSLGDRRFPNRQPAHPGAMPLGVRLLWRTGAAPLRLRFLNPRRSRPATSALYPPPLLPAELHPLQEAGPRRFNSSVTSCRGGRTRGGAVSHSGEQIAFPPCSCPFPE